VKFGVSVYIPNRNHAATLPAAIYSAASQMPVEVAVIDDASTDDSVAVADAAAMTYDSVWLHRNTVKAPCWEQAAAEQFTFFGGSHIIGLSADDELHPGVVQSTMRHPNAAVIFHSYYCRKPGRDPHGAVPMPFHQVTAMTKAEACQHISSDALPVETGIGSAIRWNWLMWLCQYEYWRMGGCVHVPQAGAIFTEDDAGYGVTQRNSTDSGRYMVECWAFLKRAGVPQDVAAAICRKRGVDA